MQFQAKLHKARASTSRWRPDRRGYLGAVLFAGALAYGCAQSAYDPAPWDGDTELDEQEFPASVEDTDASLPTGRSNSAAEPATVGSATTSSGEIEARASADAATGTKTLPEAGAGSASGGRADAGSDAGSRDASVNARDAGDGTLDAGAGKSASPDAGAKTDAGSAPTTRDAGTGASSSSNTCKENADCPSSKCGIAAPFACCSNRKCGCSWFDLAYCQT
ncbi:MAG: hypothetical protein RL385_1825 [Pseudomonadota bacterium]|jgi:hypothetical protein